jgi:hypothetical protein
VEIQFAGQPGVLCREGESGAGPAVTSARLAQSRHRHDAGARRQRTRAPCRPSRDPAGGDASYYGRFGFSAAATGGLWMPGRFERNRLFALELKSGALKGVRGMIGPTGQFEPKPDLNALVAASRRTLPCDVRRKSRS